MDVPVLPTNKNLHTIRSVQIQDEVEKTRLKQWMIGTDDERVKGIYASLQRLGNYDI